jgi:hypothetical protein
VSDDDFIDACAMLSLVGIIIRGNILSNHHEDAMEAYSRAQKMLEYRNMKDEEGIVSIKKRTRKAK